MQEAFDLVHQNITHDKISIQSVIMKVLAFVMSQSTTGMTG